METKIREKSNIWNTDEKKTTYGIQTNREKKNYRW